MNYKGLKDVDVRSLPNLDEKTREMIIKEGKDVYIQGLKEVCELLNADLTDMIITSILITEAEITIETKNENYELCYFLSKIVKQIKTEYGL
jgi:hypothetical protein